MPQPERQVVRFTPLPLVRPFLWWVAGWRLWRPAPLRWIVACMVPLVVEGVLQFIPEAGIVVSKIVVTIVGAGLFQVMDELSRTGRFSWRGLAWGLHARNLPAALQLAVVMLAGYAVDVVVAWTVYGAPGLDVALFGRNAEHRELVANAHFVLVLVLPGLVANTLLMLCAPLVVLQGVNPWAAAWRSVRWFAGAPLAFAVVLAVSLILVDIAMPRFWPLLVVIPWIAAMEYAAYLDVFGNDPERAMKAMIGRVPQIPG